MREKTKPFCCWHKQILEQFWLNFSLVPKFIILHLILDLMKEIKWFPKILNNNILNSCDSTKSFHLYKYIPLSSSIPTGPAWGSSGWQALIKWMTRSWMTSRAGNDQAPDRRRSTGWASLTAWLSRLCSCSKVGADLAVGRWWSIDWQVLIKQLIRTDQPADRCWSSGWQVLINWLTGSDQTAE